MCVPSDGLERGGIDESAKVRFEGRVNKTLPDSSDSSERVLYIPRVMSCQLIIKMASAPEPVLIGRCPDLMRLFRGRNTRRRR